MCSGAWRRGLLAVGQEEGVKVKYAMKGRGEPKNPRTLDQGNEGIHGGAHVNFAGKPLYIVFQYSYTIGCFLFGLLHAARRLENIQLCLGSSYGLRAIGRVWGFLILYNCFIHLLFGLSAGFR